MTRANLVEQVMFAQMRLVNRNGIRGLTNIQQPDLVSKNYCSYQRTDSLWIAVVIQSCRLRYMAFLQTITR